MVTVEGLVLVDLDVQLSHQVDMIQEGLLPLRHSKTELLFDMTNLFILYNLVADFLNLSLQIS